MRDTIEIATGDCPRRKDIQFVFYPSTEGLANDYASNDMQLSFSFRVKVCFENQFFCIKYIPIHFTWWGVCCSWCLFHAEQLRSLGFCRGGDSLILLRDWMGNETVKETNQSK